MAALAETSICDFPLLYTVEKKKEMCSETWTGQKWCRAGNVQQKPRDGEWKVSSVVSPCGQGNSRTAQPDGSRIVGTIQLYWMKNVQRARASGRQTLFVPQNCTTCDPPCLLLWIKRERATSPRPMGWQQTHGNQRPVSLPLFASPDSGVNLDTDLE